MKAINIPLRLDRFWPKSIVCNVVALVITEGFDGRKIIIEMKAIAQLSEVI